MLTSEPNTPKRVLVYEQQDLPTKFLKFAVKLLHPELEVTPVTQLSDIIKMTGQGYSLAILDKDYRDGRAVLDLIPCIRESKIETPIIITHNFQLTQDESRVIFGNRNIHHIEKGPGMCRDLTNVLNIYF